METLVIIVGSFLHIKDDLQKNAHITCAKLKVFNIKNNLNSRNIISYDLTDKNFQAQDELENSIMLADVLVVIDDDLKSPETIGLIAGRLDAGDRTILVSHGQNTANVLKKFNCTERQEDIFILAQNIKKIFSGVS